MDMAARWSRCVHSPSLVTEAHGFIMTVRPLLVSLLLIVGHQLPGAEPLEIQNGVVGTPIVECHENTLFLTVRTQDTFLGNVFVKGKSLDEQCSQKYDKNKDSRASFEVSLGRCGMQRLRSASPRGLSFSVTIIVSFHPIFITRTDKAYHVRCFYLEPEEVVTTNLDVSDIPTTPLLDTMSMPTCEYSVHLHSPDGPLVHYANVGEKVFHVWSCSGVDMGMMVKACSVSDGRGNDVNVVDYDGCTVDYSLLQQLTYDRSLMRAHAESHVFKYADRNTLFFSCQIRLCQKMLDMCRNITPPRCAHLEEKRRSRRDYIETITYSTESDTMHMALLNDSLVGAYHDIDVTTPELLVLDLDTLLNDSDTELLPDSPNAKFVDLRALQEPPPSSRRSQGPSIEPLDFVNFAGGKYCLSAVGIASMLTSFLLTIFVASCTSVLCYRAKQHHVLQNLVSLKQAGALPLKNAVFNLESVRA